MKIPPRTTRRTVRTSRRLIVLGIAALAFSLTACATASQEFAARFACRTAITISGEPVTWTDEVIGMRPLEVAEADDANWNQLVRQLNHFGGGDDTQLADGQVILIPRACAGQETPTTAEVTFTAAPTPPTG